MCDADDSDSQCAKSCEMHDFDEDTAVITEDEKPDENEEFEQYSEISFELELTLDYGSTDGKSLSDVASQISEDLKSVYQNINPFDQAVTTVGVSIEEVERCMSTEDLGLQPEDLFDSEDCDPEADKRRKRKSADSFKQVTMNKMTAAVTFTGEAAGSVPVSSRGMITFRNKIIDALWKLLESPQLDASHIELLSDEQLCDYAAAYLGVTRSYLSKAISINADYFETSSSAEFMALKPIETKKSEGNTKFYLHSWMGSLRDNVKDLPLSMIAIPGSHNSASYDLEFKFTWKPTSRPTVYYYDTFYWESKQDDFDKRDAYFYEVKKFYGINRHLRHKLTSHVDFNPFNYGLNPVNEFDFFKAWNTCLRSNTEDQLKLGIRYFDYK